MKFKVMAIQEILRHCRVLGGERKQRFDSNATAESNSTSNPMDEQTVPEASGGETVAEVAASSGELSLRLQLVQQNCR